VIFCHDAAALSVDALPRQHLQSIGTDGFLLKIYMAGTIKKGI
jgi:hypothetical protein